MQEKDHIHAIAFNEAFLQVISKSAFDFVAVVHEDDGSILFANEKGAEIFEYPNAESLKGIHIRALIKDYIDEAYFPTLNKDISIDNVASKEARYVTKKGETFWGHMQLNPFTVLDRNYLLVQIGKIDRAKQAEQTLLLEQQRFGTLMNYISIGVIIVNKEHKIVLANPFASVLFGYSQKELAGKKVEMLIPQRFRMNHEKYHDKYFANPQSRPMGVSKDIYGLKKDGTEFPIDVSLAHFEKDKTNFTIAFVNDITQEKKRLEQLKANEERVRLLIEHAPAAVAMFDRDMRYIMVSKRFIEDYRLAEKDIIGHSHYEIFPEIPQKWKKLHEKCLAGETISCDEELFERRDGHNDWIKWEMCPWHTATNEIGGIILFTEVITKRKQAEIALQQLNRNLEKKVSEKTRELTGLLKKEKELGELKSRFVTIASHEFRTPLSTVLSSAYLIEKYQTEEEQPKRVKHVERIISSVSSLTDILNDFLSVGKIEEGKITPKFTLFDIHTHITQILKEINVIKKKGQNLIYHHAGNTEVYLDAALFKHIIINLLTNAIKFSAENTAIDIRTERTDDCLMLHVKDKGMGISNEDQQYLFQRFFRGANVTDIQGTGLGLHIAQKYTELMNGIITCRSELEKGTEFLITFKLNNK